MSDVAYLKRVVGLPGDKVELKNQHAYVNGTRLSEPYLHPLPHGASKTAEADWGPYSGAEGYVPDAR